MAGKEQEGLGMNEQNMLEKIRQSAQDIKVPDSLRPEQMQKQLQKKHRTASKMAWQKTLAAACLCVCFGAGGLAYAYQNYAGSQQAQWENAGSRAGTGRPEPGSSIAGMDADKSGSRTDDAGKEAAGNAAGMDADKSGSRTDDAGKEAAESISGMHTEEGSASADGADKDAANPLQEAPLKKIGKLYTLASDYGEVYDVLEKSGIYQNQLDGSSDGGIKDLQKEEARMEAASDSSGGQKLAASLMAEDDAAGYSTTNLQVEGVDESDIIKTDGSYIYAAQNTRIQLIDIRNGIPKKAGVIELELDEDTDKICGMYAADDRLTVITQTEQTTLKEGEYPAREEEAMPEAGKGSAEDDRTFILPEDEENKSRQGMIGLGEYAQDEEAGYAIGQYLDIEVVTRAVSYDISDPKKPVFVDEAAQDGRYQDSRKIGNRLYLFTNISLRLDDGISRKKAVKEEYLRSWIPSVDGEPVPADCIYLPKRGTQGILMSSIDLGSRHQVLDTKLLVTSSAQLYASSTSAYFYYSEYAGTQPRTRIARFSLGRDGIIRAEAAKTVKGTIQDTFAIHEQDGYLQVLTSITGSEPWENRVYVLDEELKTAGKLTGLAKGERIYAARFIGKTGYFVTYRNTDPLFTVDFSDPQHPEIIGELKVTGFSDYLHFWGDDRLLGIGLETDPESGETIGVKLSMFDISDPSDVKEEAKLILEDMQDSRALQDYKSVLVNKEKNMIALTVENYRNTYREDFRVFSYQNGKFASKIQRQLAAGYDAGRDICWRSLFAGDMLYLASAGKTIAFDMRKGWRETAKLVYAQ